MYVWGEKWGCHARLIKNLSIGLKAIVKDRQSCGHDAIDYAVVLCENSRLRYQSCKMKYNHSNVLNNT